MAPSPATLANLPSLLKQEDAVPGLLALVLDTLGTHGLATAADVCVELLWPKPVAALAGEAFSAVTGLRIAEQYAAPREEEDEALPPLEEEDLDADLTPKPEHATPQALLEALVRAPMRRRHALALELALRSRGAIQLPTRAFVKKQVVAWTEARSVPASAFSRPFAEGLRS